MQAQLATMLNFFCSATVTEHGAARASQIHVTEGHTDGGTLCSMKAVFTVVTKKNKTVAAVKTFRVLKSFL